MGRYSKTLVAALATVAAAILAAFMPDSVVSTVEWVNVAIIAVGLVPTFYVANSPAAPVAKAIVGAATAALTLLTTLIAGGLTVTEWSQVAAAFVGAILVWAVPNTPAGDPAWGGPAAVA
ncbi:hypothetical protein GCM10023201_40730 [Actinomycetospora corticicola]